MLQIEIYIAEKGLYCEPRDVYDYWEGKGWLTAKQKEVKTLESAICSYNSIAINEATKKKVKSLGIKKIPKKQKHKKVEEIRKSIASTKKNIHNAEILESFELKKSAPSVDKKREFAPYKEQLKDKRWEAFRKFVFSVRGKKCEICGGNHILQIHHPEYKSGRLAWEYTCNEVMVVCNYCHETIHQKQHKTREL